MSEVNAVGGEPQCYSVDADDAAVASGENSSLGLLSRASGLSYAVLKAAAAKGAVWLHSAPRDGGGRGEPRRLRRLKRPLSSGERLYLNYHPALLAEPSGMAKLLFDGGDYSVWIKPAGMRCQGSKWADHSTLYRCAEKQLQPPRVAFVVHRLDRMTAGLVLLAHNKKSAAALSAQFAERTVKKVYRAVVNGEVVAELPLRIDKPLEGKSAVTILLSSQPARHTLPSLCDTQSQQLLEPIEQPAEPVMSRNVTALPTGFSLLTLTIESGRKHQIRRHLATLGYPLLGDRLYAGKFPQCTVDLQLQAVSLSFFEPRSGRRKTFSIGGELLVGNQ